MALVDNQVAYWKLDGNSNDAVGSNNGTDTGITYSTSDGKINQGANFNAITDKIAFPSSSAFRLTSNYSISVWYKATSCVGSADIWGVYEPDTGGQKGYGLFLSGTTFFFDIYYAGGSGRVTWSYANAQNGSWHHLVLTYDGSTAHLYVDGNQQGTGQAISSTAAYAGNEYPHIGPHTWGGGTTDGFIGSIDELGFWNKVLSSTEVEELYNSGAAKQYPYTSIKRVAGVLSGSISKIAGQIMTNVKKIAGVSS